MCCNPRPRCTGCNRKQFCKKSCPTPHSYPTLATSQTYQSYQVNPAAQAIISAAANMSTNAMAPRSRCGGCGRKKWHKKSCGIQQMSRGVPVVEGEGEVGVVRGEMMGRGDGLPAYEEVMGEGVKEKADGKS